MALFFTRCPHCQTAFRISHAQLRAADGLARCGACKEVFSAEENRSFPDNPADLESLETTLENALEPALESAPESALDNAEKAFFSEINNPAEEPVLLTEPEPEHSTESEEKPQSLPEESIASFSETNDASTPPDERLDGDSDINDESFIKVAEVTEPEEIAEPALKSTDNEFTFSAEFIDNFDTDIGSAQTGFARATTEHTPSEALYQDPEDSKAPNTGTNTDEINLTQLEDAPIELLTSDVKAEKRTRILLILGGLIGIAGLLVQYFFYNISTLQKDSRFDPAFNLICPYIDCPPIPTTNVAAIQSDELLVRTHPTIEKALLVTFIFRNKAPFEQAFPLVELSFTSPNNRFIASRSFTPEEYLPEQLQQFEEMPINSPVQAEIAIVDPGPEAVNYTLQFRLR